MTPVPAPPYAVAHRIPRPIRCELRVRLQRGQRPGVLPPRYPVRPAQLFPCPDRRPPAGKSAPQTLLPARHPQSLPSWLPFPSRAISMIRRAVGEPFPGMSPSGLLTFVHLQATIPPRARVSFIPQMRLIWPGYVSDGRPSLRRESLQRPRRAGATPGPSAHPAGESLPPAPGTGRPPGLRPASGARSAG